MSFVDAIKTVVLEKYCCFTGRARRSEYWWFCLANIILNSVFSQVSPYISGVISLALLLPGLGVAVRRLHDVGKSGWYLLFSLIPIAGAIILIIFLTKDSEPDNIYGPNPKADAPTTV